jgi:hypothetical protein
MNPSFLLDEQLPKWWRKQILHLQPQLSIWRIGDPPAPELGTLDPVILEWCETQDAFLVTNNRTSMPTHLADHVERGRHVPGIFVVDPGRNIVSLADDLALIEGASFPDEFRDQIQYLPLT